MSLVNVQLGAAPEPLADGQASRDAAIADNLGQILHGKFTEWSQAKRDIEDDWLRCLRAYNGTYEPEIEAQLGNRSKVYVHLTRTKTLAAFARIIDLMLGNDRHWSVSETPIPRLSPDTAMDLIAAIQKTHPGIEPSEEQLEIVANELAKKAASRMQDRIEDQYVDAGYDDLFKTAVMEACILGSGAMKGPVVRTRTKRKWVKTPDGYEIQGEDEVVPGLEAPSVFDLYPDPYATSMENADGIFERHVMTAKHMRDLGEMPGFDTDAIEEIIRWYPNGNHTDLDHEIERRRIAKVNDATATNRRYDVLEYWGQVTGADLQAAGVEVHADSMTAEVQANVWFSGQRSFRVQLNPLMPERIPYQIFRYEKVPHQFWGIGVPRQMRDSQTIINAAVRATLDNLAISSGPQIEVNLDLLAPGESAKDFYGWRVWGREGGDSGQPLLRVYDMENVTQAFAGVIDMARKFMDEETSMPSYTHGEQMPGLNKTASGISMLMGAANVVLKSVIKNIDDDLVKPTARGMYDFNMQWSDDESIKGGDMEVEARGSTALLAKEVQSQRIIQFLTMTNNPIDIQLVGPKKRANLLRQAAKAMDLNPDEVGPDEDQFDQPGNVAPGGGGDLPPVVPPGMGAPAGVPGAPPGGPPQ